jgi:transitional endoplasmic reticulum ATPase
MTGRLMGKAASSLYLALAMSAGLAWCTYAYWLALQMRDTVVRSYGFIAVLGVAAHMMDLIIKIPWADREYPLIYSADLMAPLLKNLSFHMLAFGCLLLAAGALQTHGARSIGTHLPAAMQLLALGSATFIFARWQPSFGFKVPSLAQVKDAGMGKYLSNIPDYVWESALETEGGGFGRGGLAYRTSEKLNIMFFVLTYCAWGTYVYWLVAQAMSFDFVRDSIPTMRNFIVWSYFGFVMLGLLAYWLDLVVKIPWADRDYPLVNDGTHVARVFRPLGLHMLAFGALLLAAGVMKTHGAQSINTYLREVLMLLGLGGAALAFSIWPPSLGFKVPASNDRRGSGQRYTQAVEAAPADNQPPEYSTPVEARPARQRFDSIFGMQAVKDKLLAPAQKILAKRLPGTEAPGNGILLHGEPGNGKTVFAEALAGELNVPIIQLTYGDVSSKWVGEMPRLLSNCFAYAKRHAPCVLFIDEIDSFIPSRDIASNNSEEPKITNTLLTEIVNLRDHAVVLVAATNYLDKLDTAAIREGRFDHKVEITPPDEPARIGLIAQGVKKYAAGFTVDEADMISVARRWAGFSVSRLIAVTKALPEYARIAKVDRITHLDWMGALRAVQGRNGRVPQNTKGLNDLVLDVDTREALRLVASRLADVARIESLGGTLPNGTLFYGPAGTGKTAAARALAKESGWAFLSVAGPDLVADREKLTKLYREAKDIRPTIIFIDEADEVLRNRQYRTTPDLTNRMLVLMDGTDEKIPDVVWIAATNYPDQIDPALLRAGRFTEKVQFAPPPGDQIPRHIANWLKAKSVALEAGMDAFDLASKLDGQTIANIDGVLQYALNRAISRCEEGQLPLVNNGDLDAAMRVVLDSAAT